MKRGLKNAMLNRFFEIENDEKFIIAAFCIMAKVSRLLYTKNQIIEWLESIRA